MKITANKKSFLHRYWRKALCSNSFEFFFFSFEFYGAFLESAGFSFLSFFFWSQVYWGVIYIKSTLLEYSSTSSGQHLQSCDGAQVKLQNLWVTPRKASPWASVVHLLRVPNAGDQWSVFGPRGFALSRTPDKWNHRECRPLSVASLTSQFTAEIRPCCGTGQSCSFLGFSSAPT